MFSFLADTRLQQERSRNRLRRVLGSVWFFLKRQARWIFGGRTYSTYQTSTSFPYVWMTHRVVLRRHLSPEEEKWNDNKIHNLRIALTSLDGLVIRPGEFFSFWKCLGVPLQRKGYREGLFLAQGRLSSGIGGGLCQLSNFLFWMMLHTPVTITERWRHSFDVFPDRARTQPFGSGATCFFPSLDLECQNRTNMNFQIHIWMTETELCGEWRADHPKKDDYQVVERDHRIETAPFGGYVRSNALWRVVSRQGVVVHDECVCKNAARMMYAPLLETEPVVV